MHQSYGGIAANDPDEAMYYGTYADINGTPFSGDKIYKIHFPKGTEPEVKSFWSISMYDKKGNMVENPISRYSIGDRTVGLIRNAEGDLVVALQHEQPTDKDVNWLPTPEGRFWMVFRAYQPEGTVLTGEWQPPQVSEVL